MVLNVGIISAFIVFKNRPGAMTRLQKLQKQLSQKPIATKTLYSYPVKKIFTIFIILCFMAGLMLFLREYKLEIHEKYQISEHQSNQYISKINKNDSFLHHLNSKMQNFPRQVYNQYLNVESTVHLIVLFFTIPLLILGKQLNFQRLIVRKKQFGDSQQTSGHIEKQQYNILKGWQTTNNILCQENDLIYIELCGQQRFTNTTYYYAIKKATKSDQQNKTTSNLYNQFYGNGQQKEGKLEQEVIIRKGNVYEARRTLIYICHILGKEIKLNIKNAPTKQVKKKEQRKPMKRGSTTKKD